MVPTVLGGVTAVIDVLELMTKLAAGVLPKYTATVPSRSVPVMLTDVPPPLLPLEALRLVSVGTGAAV
jgi:hypothetical protein